VIRIGHAWDTHRIVKGRKLILGGVKIESEVGLLGHSDADVVLHAVAESLLGSLALGDLGTHFPDTYKLPTHPTFSTESKYSNNATPGGTWVEYPDGTWVFNHSPYTARHLDDTDDYLGANVDNGGTPELSYWNGSFRLPTITVRPKSRRSLKYGGIYIKPENRGKFTETMRRTGKTAEQLKHSSNPLTRKRATFAINARKWNH